MRTTTSNILTYIISYAVYVTIVDFIATPTERFQCARNCWILLVLLEEFVVAGTVQFHKHLFDLVKYYVIRDSSIRT